MESLFIPINIETIRDNSIQSFDLFYRLADEKMVLYCSSGSKVDEEQKKIVSDNSIDKLYIAKKDKVIYNFYLEEMLPSILNDPKINTPLKAKISYETVTSIAKTVFESPKAENIARYKKTILDTLEFVLKDNEALQRLIALTTFDFTVYNHCVNVGLFGIGLAKELLKDSPEHDFREISAGFFLHDIGKINIPPDILNKKGPLSHVEWKIVKRHTEDGCEILGKHNALSKETHVIVSQHHERHDGFGYPNGLKGNQIHIYARICSIADAFDGLTSFRPFKNSHSAFDALKIMRNEMFRHFDPVYFTKFIKLFSN